MAKKNKVKTIMYISIGQVAKVIVVSISTLRKWEDEQFFKCDFRTKGGHRRYDLSKIESGFLNKKIAHLPICAMWILKRLLLWLPGLLKYT